MSLSPGTRLGPYEILSPLGAGRLQASSSQIAPAVIAMSATLNTPVCNGPTCR
jgi:hypothetical protein